MSLNNRRIRPDISSMLAAAKAEATSIASLLDVEPEKYSHNPANISRLVSIIGDIEALYKIDPSAPLMRSEEYRDIVDLTALVLKVDNNFTITYANDLFCSATGYNYRDIIGSSIETVCHRASLDSYKNAISQRDSLDDVIFCTKDGGEFHVEVHFSKLFDHDGDFYGCVAIHYDITDAVNQRTLNTIILDEQPNIIAVISKEDGILSLNKAFFGTFPFNSISDFYKTHTSFFDLFIESENTCNISKSKWWVERILNNTEAHDRRLKALDKNGEIRIFEVSGRALANSSKLAQEIQIISLNDITVAQNEADNAKNEAQEAHRESYAKSSFLANMSHEIRTPLNGIIPIFELLNETKLDNEQKEYVSLIKKSATSLLDIINDILDFSKIESGSMVIEEVDFDPVTEMESIVDLFAAKAHDKNIGYYAFIDPSIPTCMLGDPLRIKQVLSNLIGNAIKFTHHGKVEISAELIETKKRTNTIRISVKDSGVGINNESLESIFSPFSQADNSITRNFGGTGLGLSISNNLVRSMGSILQVSSQLGLGSVFSFDIRLKTCTASRKRFGDDLMLLSSKHIGIYMACLEDCNDDKANIFKYLDSFHIDYTILNSYSELLETKSDTLFVLSDGINVPYWINEAYKNGIRVVTFLPLGAKNRTLHHSHATVSAPLNGSKIFDAIIEGRASALSDIENISTMKADGVYDARILLVEDNSTNQLVATALLKRFNLRPVIADNGQEAIDAVLDLYHKEGIAYDLIFMDIHMQVMDGILATRKIRDYEAKLKMKHAPIIALTADAVKGREEEYLCEGMDGFIAKPISRESFDEAIRNFIPHKRVSDILIGPILEQLNKESPLDKIVHSLGIDITVAEMLLNDFMTNWWKYKQAFAAAIQNDNTEEAREIAHALKGSAGSLLLVEAEKLAFMLESVAISGDVAKLRSIFQELTDVIEN